MTKAKLSFLGIALILAFCLALFGCGGNTSTSSNSAENFIGTWEVSSANYNGTTYGENELKALSALGSKVELVVNEDKTFNLAIFGESVSGTWEAKDAKTARVAIAGQETDATIGDDGLLSLSYEGSSISFKKTS